MADTESTCTSVDERTEDLVSPTRDALVDGIVGLLKPCLDQLDDRVRATRSEPPGAGREAQAAGGGRLPGGTGAQGRG